MPETYGYIKAVRAKVGHMPLILNCAAGILLNEQREVLLNHRTDNGTWSLPGGYMEYGETYAQTLIREYKEDSGLDVAIVRQLHCFDQGETIYSNGDVCQTIAMLYEVRQIGGSFEEADPNETTEMKYWPLDGLPPLLNQQNADMIAYAAKHC
ncbi:MULTISPECIES: NUDIX hydrolase [unclassified Lacticaseibacillus]|uniref:NUDIX hydrolase n=1 Tax=unclassified Lacticaseibacillus TaxID=2759744 RepID=UPI0019419C04|nr:MULTISPECIES: NUDIX hydrolase [unclassified Lacticaseibacillus]